MHSERVQSRGDPPFFFLHTSPTLHACMLQARVRQKGKVMIMTFPRLFFSSSSSFYIQASTLLAFIFFLRSFYAITHQHMTAAAAASVVFLFYISIKQKQKKTAFAPAPATGPSYSCYRDDR